MESLARRIYEQQDQIWSEAEPDVVAPPTRVAQVDYSLENYQSEFEQSTGGSFPFRQIDWQTRIAYQVIRKGHEGHESQQNLDKETSPVDPCTKLERPSSLQSDPGPFNVMMKHLSWLPNEKQQLTMSAELQAREIIGSEHKRSGNQGLAFSFFTS